MFCLFLRAGKLVPLSSIVGGVALGSIHTLARFFFGFQWLLRIASSVPSGSASVEPAFKRLLLIVRIPSGYVGPGPAQGCKFLALSSGVLTFGALGKNQKIMGNTDSRVTIHMAASLDGFIARKDGALTGSKRQMNSQAGTRWPQPSSRPSLSRSTVTSWGQEPINRLAF
jgi:hypothetical protein